MVERAALAQGVGMSRRICSVSQALLCLAVSLRAVRAQEIDSEYSLPKLLATWNTTACGKLPALSSAPLLPFQRPMVM